MILRKSLARYFTTSFLPPARDISELVPGTSPSTSDWAKEFVRPFPAKQKKKKTLVPPKSEAKQRRENSQCRLPPENESPRPRMLQPPPALTYSRRVEGLLDNDNQITLEDLNPASEHRPIAKLAHGLDRVLFNPGVHWIQDPRSRVYNFTPYLEFIPKVTDFAFDRLTGFVKSSLDEDLLELAKREKRTFAGSTSSLTGILSHIYFLISEGKDVDLSTLSQNFKSEPADFTAGQRMPVSVVMNYRDGMYAIDSSEATYVGSSSVEKATEKNILTWLGTLLEKYLTLTPEEFTPYMRSTPPPEEKGEPIREAYRYSKSDKFIMRSQLDCHDGRLPGTGVFDIKTRACLPIRLDLLNYEENSGYLLRKRYGIIESFEKEYYDLIRSAFLKYSFQARIGNMDGVIVAYHNTERMFGFQYIPLEEMDHTLFGTGEGAGERVFGKCVAIMEQVADEITRCFPEQSVRCTFETIDKTMNVWIEPLVWELSEERPIAQLEIKTDSYINNVPTNGPSAVADVGNPWTLHWSISRLSGLGIDMHGGLAGARRRQFRAWSIPTGIASEDLAEFWGNINFSGKEKAEGAKSMFRPEFFKKPSTNIELLRSVARAGREKSRRLAEAEHGKPKIVLGSWGDLAQAASQSTDWEPEAPSYETEPDGVGQREDDILNSEQRPPVLEANADHMTL